MKNVRLDTDGNPRCWKCGSKGFTEKRTFRSKAMVGVGALLAHKKLKCQRCGEYNLTGHGKPYDGPASRKYRKEWEAEQEARKPAEAPTAQPVGLGTELEKLAALHADGAITDDELATAKDRLLNE